MATIHVQFADETEQTIVSCFLSPQDPKHWNFLGVVEATDPRWHAYYMALPTHVKPSWPAPA